jgi:glycerol-3-phosphate dehydrogenase (NAD(P)+)
VIRVVGAGAFGTALAIALCRVAPVALWARDDTHAATMRAEGRNEARLPGIALPAGLQIESGPVAPDGVEATLLAVPMQRLRALCEEARPMLLGGGPLVACCKGMELGTGLHPTGVIADVLPEARAAILTGPSFASDIARGLPTALTLACRDEEVGAALQTLLSTETLRLYRTRDVTGAELGGALKNVMAIACGAAMGAGLGDSARAALLTRGFAEMVRTAQAMGAERQTLSGLSGFGDLVLTCTSEQSRNFRFGMSLGRGEGFDPATTVEGAATAEAFCAVAEDAGLDLPITRAVMQLVKGQLRVKEAMDMLLSRPLKEE